MSRDIFREIDSIYLSSAYFSMFYNDRGIHLGNNKPGTVSIGNQVNRLKLKFDESRMNEKTERFVFEIREERVIDDWIKERENRIRISPLLSMKRDLFARKE